MYSRTGKALIIGLIVILFLSGSLAQGQRKEIIGYYPSWKWNLHTRILSPEKIPYDKLTMINYAFFYPKPDGSLIGRDTVGDRLILGGATEGDAGKNRLTDLAHRHGVKVLLSIGGWEDSNNFPPVAAVELLRINFAHSCLQQIRTYGFDGIDIDWEYPGYADHNGSGRDKENFTKLLSTVRDSLTSYGRQVGRRFLLTAALPAFESALRNYEVDRIVSLLDQLNIMTYDFNGPWSPLSGHNAPLYASSSKDSLGNLNAAFKLYTETFRIPASKINLGVPFYGHALSNCTGLNLSHGGADTTHFSSQGAFYYDIAPLVKDGVRVWDDRAKVPYLVCNEWRTFISYDDEESVGDKARYVLDNNASGLIIWEITGDFMGDGVFPLLNVIYATFAGSVQK